MSCENSLEQSSCPWLPETQLAYERSASETSLRAELYPSTASRQLSGSGATDCMVPAKMRPESVINLRRLIVVALLPINGRAERKLPQPPPASLSQSSLVQSAFFGQAAKTCLSAPNICSLEPPLARRHWGRWLIQDRPGRLNTALMAISGSRLTCSTHADVVMNFPSGSGGEEDEQL